MRPLCSCILHEAVLNRLANHPNFSCHNELGRAAHECCAAALLLFLATCEDPQAFVDEIRQHIQLVYQQEPPTST